MSTRTIVVVSAGLSQPSSSRLLGDRLGASTAAAIADLGEHAQVEHVELRGHARGLVDHLLTGFPTREMQAVIDGVLAADGLVVVSPVFNASFSGLFKLFFDVIERGALTGAPVLLAATGGTTRHSLVLDHAMRPLFSYLGAATVPTAVYAASADWGSTAEDGLATRIDRAGRELAAAVAGRPGRRPQDPFANPPAFADVMQRTGQGLPD